jgi:hypothetical protein
MQRAYEGELGKGGKRYIVFNQLLIRIFFDGNDEEQNDTLHLLLFLIFFFLKNPSMI